jgi:uncharacterized protein YggT (Ycf19 family)
VVFLIRIIVQFIFSALIALISGGVILSLIRTVLRPTWGDHPAVRAVIAVSDALCAPFRRLMQHFGIPTRPLDFSPMVAVLALELLQAIVMGILNLLP